MLSPAACLDGPLQKLLDKFERDRNAEELLLSRTALVDAAVLDAGARYLPDAGCHPFVVSAVGGYGRRELFPYSDIDLLIFTEDEARLKALQGPLSEFLRVLWDGGMRISHSVRTVSECSRLHEDNPELHVSLLDLRHLAGDQGLYEALRRKLTESFERFRPAIVQRLVQLTRVRHAKFNRTVYHLEPNIKETCGGVRDLHLLRWLSQLLPQREILQEALAELEPAAATEHFSSSRNFLFVQRSFLHLRNHRDANVLTFELQDQSAQKLPDNPVPPEDWMRLYFGHARKVFQSSVRALEYAESQDSSLVSQFREWRTRLSTAEFTIARERIYLRNPAETLESPAAILRLFTFAARHGFQLSWDTQRRLRQRTTEIAGAFRREPPVWPTWREFFQQPDTALALDEMQKTGVLAAAIPDWQAIDSLVVRDFYHRYTVDEHTLIAIQSLDDLPRETGDAPDRFRKLASEEDQLFVLRIALLLHDFGKGTNPGDHVRGSLEAAPRVMKLLGVPVPIQRMVLFLIEHHLDLSLIMNGRDLEDSATARFLTARVETQEDLRRLTLLTYADISAVNPTAMTPWRLEQLWRVYLLGSEQLTRELASNRLHHVEAPVAGAPSAALAEFLEGFPKRYLRTHTPEEIAHHLELESVSRREGVAVEIRPESGFWLMTVLAHDKPGLFASLCGVLASFGMNILKGEASSNAAGTILDLIRFSDPNRTLELNPEEVNRLVWTVQCVVRGKLEVADLLKRRRPIRRFAGDSRVLPVVTFNNEASDSATLIDFSAEDRPGLLYDLASAITTRGCNIEVVMIDTEAHKAIDVFYVTRAGGKLNSHMQEILESDLLKAASLNR